jgi:hypothetical protein
VGFSKNIMPMIPAQAKFSLKQNVQLDRRKSARSLCFHDGIWGKGFLSPGLANPTSVPCLTIVLVSSPQPSVNRDSLNEEMGHTTTVHGKATYTNYFHSPMIVCQVFYHSQSLPCLMKAMF